MRSRRQQGAPVSVFITSDVADTGLVREFLGGEESEDELYDLLDGISKGWSVAEDEFLLRSRTR